MALGDMGDARAVPGVVKAMYRSQGLLQGGLVRALPVGPAGGRRAGAVAERRGQRPVRVGSQNESRTSPLSRRPFRCWAISTMPVPRRPCVALVAYKSEFDDIKLIDAHARRRRARAHALEGGREGDRRGLRRAEATTPGASTCGPSRASAAKEPLAKLLETSAQRPLGSPRAESMRGVAMLADDPGSSTRSSQAEAKLFKAECAKDEDTEECREVAASVKSHVARIKAAGSPRRGGARHAGVTPPVGQEAR